VSEEDDERASGGGFLGRGHHKLRFTELDETFFARLILAKCPDPTTETATTVEFSLHDFFRRVDSNELVALLENETVTESPKILENVVDAFSIMLGFKVDAAEKTQSALDYYQSHMLTRIEWLKSGDPSNNRLPGIEDFKTRTDDKLTVFELTLQPALLRERLGEWILADLESTAMLMQKLSVARQRGVDTGPRIDYRKQVEFLTHDLDDRQQATGETEFSILSNRIPFRWALQRLDGTDVALPSVGTSDVRDKIILPLFLEVNGFLDISGIDLESDPRSPHDVVVRYAVRRPATRNIFGASNSGLVAGTRAQLNETELTLYHRLHRKVREGLVFGGKPRLESSFGELTAWLLRKATLFLEEPCLLGEPARYWLKQHEADKMIQMEDQFLLPLIYERLRSDFGSRVVKKPERFGGEIDILFDDSIPIELKVRRDRKAPLAIADVDETFRPSGQAAVYAGVSRLGIVLVLDLPKAGTQVIALENCVTVVERRFPETAEYPTCIVVIVFRCYEASPSTSR
jgi:hypothetical protein